MGRGNKHGGRWLSRLRGPIGGGLRARCPAGHRAARAQATSGPGAAPAGRGRPPRRAARGYIWSAPRQGSARRSCRPTGRGAASSRWRGSRSTSAITTQRGSGVMGGRAGPGAAGVAERVGPLLGPPAPPSYEGLVTALTNELAAGTDADEVLLVLDDYHVIEHRGRARSRSGSLLGTGRRDCAWCWPAAATRRCRWPGCGAVGGWPSCAPRSCGSPRTRRRRCCGKGRPYPARPCRTRRWRRGRPHRGVGRRAAAGGPVAARAARCRRFVAAFTGSHRFVLDFLTEEVLEHQVSNRAHVLAGDLGAGAASAARCAPPSPAGRAARRCWSRWSGPGCSGVPLDEVRGWWRTTHLFADLLRAAFTGTTRPDELRNRHAAAWTQHANWPTTRCGKAMAAGEMTGRWPTSSRAHMTRPAICSAETVTTVSGGSSASRPSWSGPAPGCCWLRPWS